MNATVAIDPALVKAIDPALLSSLSSPFLLLNLGAPAELHPSMDLSGLAASLPKATYVAVPGARHFSFLAECSTLGVNVIGLAGEENISSDPGLRDRAIIHDELRAAIGGFLRQHLGVDG